MDGRDVKTPRTPSQILHEWRRLETVLAEVAEERADCERLEQRIHELRSAYQATVERRGAPVPDKPRPQSPGQAGAPPRAAR